MVCPMLTLPLSGFNLPVMISKKVVFPHPLVPTTPILSPLLYIREVPDQNLAIIRLCDIAYLQYLSSDTS